MKILDESMLIAKDNALINASYNLDLVEQRLILLAIIEARETGKGITADNALTIHAESYIEQFSVEKHTAYTVLKDACKNLFARQFTYQEISKNGNLTTFTSRWVSKIGYTDKEAVVQIIFAPDVVPLITRLEKQFTSYELDQVAGLQSKYAVRLYEILIAWRSTGKTPFFEIEDFRKKIGVGVSEYKTLWNFKQRVLELAIEQINEHTDITASYEQHKRGRTITGFSFKFKQKPQQSPKTLKNGDFKRDSDTIDMFTHKTDTEAKKRQKITKSEAGAMAQAGESWEELYRRLSKDYIIV
jgi:plasmid replication initiation protein